MLIPYMFTSCCLVSFILCCVWKSAIGSISGKFNLEKHSKTYVSCILLFFTYPVFCCFFCLFFYISCPNKSLMLTMFTRARSRPILSCRYAHSSGWMEPECAGIDFLEASHHAGYNPLCSSFTTKHRCKLLRWKIEIMMRSLALVGRLTHWIWGACLCVCVCVCVCGRGGGGGGAWEMERGL